jgi:hypothetical protein
LTPGAFNSNYAMRQRPGSDSYHMYMRPSSEGHLYYQRTSSSASRDMHAGPGSASSLAAAPTLALGGSSATTLRGVSAVLRTNQGLAVARSEGRSCMSIPGLTSSTGAGMGSGAPATTDSGYGYRGVPSANSLGTQLPSLQPRSLNSNYMHGNDSGVGGSSILWSLPPSQDGSVAVSPCMETRETSALTAIGYYNQGGARALRPRSTGGIGRTSGGQRPQQAAARTGLHPRSMGAAPATSDGYYRPQSQSPYAAGPRSSAAYYPNPVSSGGERSREHREAVG